MRDDEPDSIVPIATDTASLFAHFWELRRAGETFKALAVCETLLEVIDPRDFASHLRQSNARAMALRDLRYYTAAKSAHLSARPFLVADNLTLRGDHYHGLGITLTELGEDVRAFKALETARDCYEGAGEWARAANATINTARLYVHTNRPKAAHALLDSLAPQPSAEIARALAYRAEGDVSGARRAIACAFTLLADSTDEATRREALSVMRRIEGGEG